MLSARLASSIQATAWRAGRRCGSRPLTAIAASEARFFSLDRVMTRGEGNGPEGAARTRRRVAEMTASAGGKWKSASGEAMASGPSLPEPYPRAARPVTPPRGPDSRSFSGRSADGRAPASGGDGPAVGAAGTGGNSGTGGDGGCRRSASTDAVSSGADIGGESGRDFAAVKDGTETYLVAARRLEAGRVVFDRVGGSLSDRPTRHSVQVREGLHLEADVDLIFLNHSCDPNCQLEVVEPAGLGGPERDEPQPPPYLRVTVRAPEITQNQPLTIDYNAMEIDMSSPFDCGCCAGNCRGRVSGFANLPLAVQEEYTKAAAAPATSTVGERPRGAPPLTGAVRAWAKANKVPGA
eukprot:g7679.t1